MCQHFLSPVFHSRLFVTAHPVKSDWMKIRQKSTGTPIKGTCHIRKNVSWVVHLILIFRSSLYQKVTYPFIAEISSVDNFNGYHYIKPKQKLLLTLRKFFYADASANLFCGICVWNMGGHVLLLYFI